MSAIIEVRNLSKEYRLGHAPKGSETFRELITRMAKAPFQRKDPEAEKLEHFWALRDLNFDINEGEAVGIIGRNGAGKSTLLKVLSRITDPTVGMVRLRGRMASLLEVGTGFHPELTGRENIYLNGAILGMSRAEIGAKFDEIVAFSEIEQFLDTPVKRYSSGMYVRLAFAVAANLNPEILIVDEVLAVGDMAFQKKCLGKMNEVGRGGRTVLFVSHNLAAVENLCQRGIVLESGKLTFDGSSKEAVRHYLTLASARLGESGSHIVEFENNGERIPYMGKFLRRAELFTEGEQPLQEGLPMGAPLKVKIYFDLPRATESFNMGLGFDNMFGQRIFTAHSCFEPDRSHGARVGQQVFCCDIPSFTLAPGDYTTSLWLDIGNAHADEVNDAIRVNVIKSDYYGTGKVPWNGAFVLPHRWQLEEVDEAVSASQATL